MIGLCGAAAFAVSAVAVASASGAGPVYFTCAKAAKSGKKYTGRYTNKTCSEVSESNEGKYERVAPPFPVKVAGKGGEAKFDLYNPKEGTIETEVSCTKLKVEGELTSSTEASLQITYEG
jgi:hypothetical protein